MNSYFCHLHIHVVPGRWDPTTALSDSISCAFSKIGGTLVTGAVIKRDGRQRITGVGFVARFESRAAALRFIDELRGTVPYISGVTILGDHTKKEIVQ